MSERWTDGHQRCSSLVLGASTSLLGGLGFFLAKIVLVTSLERINERMNINVRSKTDDHCDKLAVERRSSKALSTS